MGEHKPVLMVAYLYPPPDNEIGAARSHRFAKYLRHLGHEVTVLAAENRGQTDVDGFVYRLRGESERMSFPARLFRKLLLPREWGEVWSLRCMRYAPELLNGSRPVVYTTSPPVPSHWVGLRLKQRYGLRWIADCRDPITGNPVRGGKRMESYDALIERAVARRADAIIANTEGAAEFLRRRYPPSAHKIRVIWNGFDPEDELRAEPLPERPYKVISHVGSIYGMRHPGHVLSTVGRLLARSSLSPADLRMRFIGDFERDALPDPDLFDRLAALGCVECTSRLPRQEAVHTMATSDYLLLLDVFYEGAGLQVPGKLYEYARIGRPILACTTRGSMLERVLRTTGIPHAVLYADDPAPEMDRKLLDFLALPTAPTAFSETFRTTFTALPQAMALSALIDNRD